MKKFTDKINESVENKIPTAEEFAEANQYELDYYDEGGYQGIEVKSFAIKLREFAKLHVEAALRAASVSAEIENCGNPYDPSDDSKCVSETSILNAYPLDNIK